LGSVLAVHIQKAWEAGWEACKNEKEIKSYEKISSKRTSFSLQELKDYHSKTQYLTCAMVAWAVKQIDNKEEDCEAIKQLLNYVWKNTSPMWQQSHWYLKEKGYVDGDITWD